MAHASLLERLRQRLEDELARVLPDGAPVALLDFPNHDNVGDSAIWIAELELLHRLGHAIVYSSSWRGWNERALRRALPRGGVVLMSGGGNFGDTWPVFQAERERIILALSDLTIVQLPQTVFFASDESAARCADVMRRHGGLTLMVRDTVSFAIARDLGAKPVLVPDAVFALHLDQPHSSSGDVVWLLRRDPESTGGSGQDSDATDWRAETSGLQSRGKASELIDRALRHCPVAAPQSLHGPLQRQLAARRLQRGMDLLIPAAVVVTDRLHGHVLATLLGIPNVVMDNTYGKLRAFYDTWTATSSLTRWADTLPDARTAARALLAAT